MTRRPARATWWCARWPPASAGPTCTRWRDFAHFTGLMDSVGVPSLDPDADCVFGHEFCAEIVEHGPDTARTLPVGTRVCSVPDHRGPDRRRSRSATPTPYPGALAEHMVLQELLLLPVPDSLDTDLAALTEPLAVGEHAVGLAGLTPGQPCLVVGCGPVGLAVIAALKGRGHGPVLAADFSPTRRRWPRPSGPTRSSTRPPSRRTTAGPTSACPQRHGARSAPPCSAARRQTRSSSRRSACPACCSRSSPTRRREPHRGGRGVHAHRHHRALHGGDQGDRAALLLRLHARPSSPPRSTGSGAGVPGADLLVTSTRRPGGAPAPSRPCARPASTARSW